MQSRLWSKLLAIEHDMVTNIHMESCEKLDSRSSSALLALQVTHLWVSTWTLTPLVRDYIEPPWRVWLILKTKLWTDIIQLFNSWIYVVIFDARQCSYEHIDDILVWEYVLTQFETPMIRIIYFYLKVLNILNKAWSIKIDY